MLQRIHVEFGAGADFAELAVPNITDAIRECHSRLSLVFTLYCDDMDLYEEMINTNAEICYQNVKFYKVTRLANPPKDDADSELANTQDPTVQYSTISQSSPR